MNFIKSGAKVDISSDYKDLFSILDTYKVKYLVIGAYAVVYYTEPRFSKDLDIWVSCDSKNTERLYDALKMFGAPLKNIGLKDFMNPTTVYQIGIAPIRVDIIMGLPGMKFSLAWKNRTRAKYADIPINIIGINDLIKTKKLTKRPQDIIDLDRLVKAAPKKK